MCARMLNGHVLRLADRWLTYARPMHARPLVALFGAVAVCSVASAQEKDARTLVAQANRAFAKEEYQAALDAYRAAEVTQPESPELAYNQGVAYFKLGDYDAAGDAFNRALLTRDLGLEARVKFNLGNVAYASALEKMSNLQEAIDLLKTGIGRYRDAIELDPEDEDARTNIETAQLLIKDLLDKLKKQQEEQKKQQQNQEQKQDQDQDQDQESKQDQQQGDQDQKQQDPSSQDDQKKQGDEQDQQQQGDPKQQQPHDQQGEQRNDEQQPQAGREMTREEAERLLQAVRDKERKRRDEKARRVRARRIPVLKDW